MDKDVLENKVNLPLFLKRVKDVDDPSLYKQIKAIKINKYNSNKCTIMYLSKRISSLY